MDCTARRPWYLDILQSCILTIVLCCWTTVCPNIQPASDGYWTRFGRKLRLACLAVLGPEFLLVIAGGQHSSARRAVKDFHNAKLPDWTLKHAFFADMGGVLLQSPDQPNFPINSQQLLFLISKDYVDYPRISEEEIDDKNKADGLARVIIICQALWFTANCIARPIQKLPLTTLELTTLSFIIVTLAISFHWRHKPKDISVPIIVETKTRISQILRDAGQEPKAYYRWTPLDFISREEWYCSLLWAYYVQILKNMHNLVVNVRPNEKPYKHIPDLQWPNISLPLKIFDAVVILAFASIFVSAWNFHFPSQIEQILWRTCSIATLVYGCLGEAHAGLFELSTIYFPGTSPFKRNPQLPDRSTGSSNRFTRQLHSLSIRLRNLSPEKDLQLEVSFRFLIFPTILCAVYCFVRAYILVEDIIALRSLEANAFNTVDWTRYLPHV